MSFNLTTLLREKTVKNQTSPYPSLLVPFSPLCVMGRKPHKMKYNSIILSGFLALVAFSCRNQSDRGPEAALPAEFQDFADFYERFHQDSAYQMEHIIFPLEGLPREADSITIASGAFRWQKEDWRMQRGFNLQSSSFEQDLIPISEGLIIEKITHKEGDLGMQRRFARLGEEWYLIYYADLNRLSAKPEISIEGGF